MNDKPSQNSQTCMVRFYQECFCKFQCQVDEQLRGLAIRITDQGQLEVSIAKVWERL